MPRPDDAITTLAKDWIDFTLRRHPETGDLRSTPAFSLPSGADAAFRTLNDLLMTDPLYLVEVVSTVWDLCDDEWVLACLGGGPLEDLLWLGDSDINALIEMDCAVSATARAALGSVWLDRLPAVSVKLVQRILWQPNVVEF